MSVVTLQQLIEEKDSKKAETRIVIGGATLPKYTSVNYSFQMGQTPTATISVPGLLWLPQAVKPEAAVEIWFGYRIGFLYQERLVFGGAIVESIGSSGADLTITCVMDGARKLTYSYYRNISYDFTAVVASDAILALLVLAGVHNYFVDEDPITGLGGWVIGTAVPQTIQFSTYGEAINEVSQVDGSQWYCLPTGQVRVEVRDGIPSTTARRTYFSGLLTGPYESQPLGITNPAARPRITDLSRDTRRDEVANFIQVDGAVVNTIGPNGEQNSEQITEQVDGASGQFPNGAFWIPTPPLFQDFTFSNELVDTNAKAFEVAERYFNLKNRLFEKIDLTVPGDPDVFLGETVRIIDPSYSGVNSLYFVEGYSTSIDSGTCTTTLNLTGGPESGTTGFAKPFAEFYWMYTALHTLTGGSFWINMGHCAQPGAKLCEDVPADSNQNPERSNNPYVDARMVIIGLDGSASQDFDGYIVSWDWTWKDQDDTEHNVSGVRWTLLIDPELQTSVEVTLTVTDNSGRTASITKHINTDANHNDLPEDDPFAPQCQDTGDGGGSILGPCTDPEPDPDNFPPPYGDPNPGPGGCAGIALGYYVAAEEFAMGSKDNRTWNDLSNGDAGASGLFISVAAGTNDATGKAYALFGTDAGEIVLSNDTCLTGEVVYSGGGAINCLWIDIEDGGIPAEGDQHGNEGGPDADSPIPVYTESSPGTMTIMQAYQQCLAVGFAPAQAVISVAIMVRESGLYSHATNTAGNTPPSTDRGICQWNNYYHPDISDACAYNTECAITKMFQKSSGGADFSPWNVSGPGTFLQGTNVAAVQAAVGFVGNVTGGGSGGSSGGSSGGTNNDVPQTLRCWAGTANGQVLSSEDSGRTWTVWFDFNDGLPINAIATPPGGSLWVYGAGVRIDPVKNKNFVPLDIEGELKTAIDSSDFGLRFEGDSKKGLGYFGPLVRPDGDIMTEFSIGVEIDGNETEIPSLVPTLTEAEVIELLNLDADDTPSPTIISKATDYAIGRLGIDKSPYASLGEQQYDLYPDLERSFSRFSEITAAAFNGSALLLAFSNADPPVWTNGDPIGTPDGWVPAVGLSGGIVAAAPGFEGEFLVA